MSFSKYWNLYIQQYEKKEIKHTLKPANTKECFSYYKSLNLIVLDLV